MSVVECCILSSNTIGNKINIHDSQNTFVENKTYISLTESKWSHSYNMHVL